MAEKELARLEIRVGSHAEQSERIAELRKRASRCVCKYCGEKLSLRKITYAAYDEAKIEVYCEKCGRIEYGVEPEIYKVAQYFVDEIGFNAFSDLDDNEKTRSMKVAKVCEIIAWGYKNLGHMDRNGFTVPVNVDKTLIGERLILDEADLPEEF